VADPAKTGDSDKLLTGGTVAQEQKHTVQINASTCYWNPKKYPQPFLNPVLEIDLGRELPIEKVIVRRPPYTGEYDDKYWRTIVVLDASRKVVSSSCFKINEAPYRFGVLEFVPVAGQGKLAGQAVPDGAQQWILPSDILPVTPLSAPSADQARRLKDFAKRNSAAGIEKLAREFFARIDLSLPRLGEAKRLYEAGRFPQALDEWKRQFLKRLACMNGVWVYRAPEHAFARAGDELLENIIVSVGDGDHCSARRFLPGASVWTGDPDMLMLDKVQKPLLDRYRRTGAKRYLDKWSEISDDWAMNYARQADASLINERQLFVMTPFDRLNVFFKDLHEIGRERPEFADAIPSATLARALMLVTEEYFPAYWRVCRQCVFNHTFNGWDAAVIPAYVLNDFYAGQRLGEENRRHFERLWTKAMMPDGSMVEIGDRGHMPTPLVSFRQYEAMKGFQWPWFTPLHESMYYDGLRSLAAFHVRQLAPADMAESFVAKILTPEDDPFLPFKAATVVTRDVLKDPEAVAILDSVFGRNQTKVPQKGDIADLHALLREAVGDGMRPVPPTLKNDWMPYSGLYFLRDGWDRDDAYFYMRCQKADGWSSATDVDNTLVQYCAYACPLASAEAVRVNGQKQNPYHGRLGLFPGSKTHRISHRPHDPMPARWLSTEAFGFCEGWYEGAYQNAGFTLQSGATGKRIELDLSPTVVTGIRAERQVMQLRGRKMFMVTDRLHGGQAAADASNRYTTSWRLVLSGANDKAPDLRQLAVDKQAVRISALNADRPGVTIPQFCKAEIEYFPPRPGRSGQELTFNEWCAPILPPAAGTVYQPVDVGESWKGGRDSVLVSLVTALPNAAAEPCTRTEKLIAKDATGFKAGIADGTEITCLAADAGKADLAAGGVNVTGGALLVVHGGGGKLTGMALDVERMTITGKTVATPGPDFQFEAGDPIRFEPMRRPIKPVRITPDTRNFVDRVHVGLSTPTPDTLIYYTTDATDPVPWNPSAVKYVASFALDKSAGIKARAFRTAWLSGHPTRLPFTTSSIDVSVPSFGWFSQQEYLPATAFNGAPADGLKYDYVEAGWFALFSYLNLPAVLPAVKSGVAGKLLDVSMRATDGTFGVRYMGYLDVPADGLYTFYGPSEYTDIVCEPGYDLRLYVDGREWDLGQTWHGAGNWSVPLWKGPHALTVTFADARIRDVKSQRHDLWSNYPSWWAVWPGKAPAIEVSGPGMARQSIPTAWLKH
jgi:hypothetical protein